MSTDQQPDIGKAVDQIEIPCDADGCDEPAMWLVTAAHQCTRHGRHGFLCGLDLTAVLTSPRPMRCTVTGQTWTPAADWLTSFQAI